VATRTTAAPKLDEKQQAEFVQKVRALAPKYRTELLQKALAGRGVSTRPFAENAKERGTPW
jgi:hypothetical protein